jgi:hypothetical protein
VGKRLCARNGALRAPIDDSGHARPSPLGCGRSPPYLRLVTGVRLAPPVSSLAEDTFAPAQPPFIVTELLGEKTNLTQKKPGTGPWRRTPVVSVKSVIITYITEHTLSLILSRCQTITYEYLRFFSPRLLFSRRAGEGDASQHDLNIPHASSSASNSA